LRNVVAHPLGIEDVSLKPHFVHAAVNVGDERRKEFLAALKQLNLMT